MREYRWEFTHIGQGHYFISLVGCIMDAVKASIKFPKSTVLVEQFRPSREELCRIKNGEEVDE